MQPFDYNIRKYMVIFTDFLEKNEINLLLDIAKDPSDWRGDDRYDTATNSRNMLVKYPDPEISKNLNQRINEALGEYFRFLGYNDVFWFHECSNYSPLRLNRYDVGSEMLIHSDHIYSMFDNDGIGKVSVRPLLSLIGSLNDDYDGGELMFWRNELINLPPGSIAIFPSNFLYPHQVNKVTKGTRYSYVSWAW